jgi:prepilin-type N-terminal cleavage/methylation domain-containing protein
MSSVVVRRQSGLIGLLRRQKGFTLIEMLVVISILGILAAVVSLSMIGITSLAQKRALDGEQMEVQSALNFMIMDQGIDPGQACAQWHGSTTDMSQFPSSTRYTQRGSGQPVALYSRYLRGQHTQRPYTCTATGAVQPG